MKKRLIKVLYAWLTLIMALLIALTGTFVPQFMLDAKADRLATQTGKVENGDVYDGHRDETVKTGAICGADEDVWERKVLRNPGSAGYGIVCDPSAGESHKVYRSLCIQAGSYGD